MRIYRSWEERSAVQIHTINSSYYSNIQREKLHLETQNSCKIQRNNSVKGYALYAWNYHQKNIVSL